MHTRSLPSALVLAAVVLMAGCGSGAPLSPTRIITVSGPSLAVTPSTLVARPVAGGACPGAPPFSVAFDLIVGTADVGATVTDIAMRFTDTRGATQPQVTLPAPVPVIPFGSALDQARSQDFPITMRIGCGTGHAGTVINIVGTRDHAGRTRTTQLSATVQ
jgi:hypothetical protein